ncbi:MAG: hypothetical protein IPI67_13560 [Myxococcales bacterium]|nr:hypothetical protein [Myxococcales bacterium]
MSARTHALHALLRMRAPGGRLAFEGFRIRPRALAQAPVVDVAGYWLISSKANGKLDVDRLSELPLLPVGWLSQVGQCW